MPRRDQSKPISSVQKISPVAAFKKLQRLLDQIPEVRAAGRKSAAAATWAGNVKIVLDEFYGRESIPYQEFGKIWFTPGAYYHGPPESEFVHAFNSGLDEATGFLKSRVDDLRETVEVENSEAAAPSVPENSHARRVFVVHGHDHGTKETVARFLAKLDLEPIILHEQADKGKTIIEKFEAHAADAQCAVVILTADDVASPNGITNHQELRARQNVILELGFFIGKLGRHRTFALVEKDVALPSDINGVI